MDEIRNTQEKEQLDALFSQQIYLLRQELKKLTDKKEELALSIADGSAESNKISDAVSIPYSKSVSKLYLRELEKQQLEKSCRKELNEYEGRLQALRDKISGLETEIL